MWENFIRAVGKFHQLHWYIGADFHVYEEYGQYAYYNKMY